MNQTHSMTYETQKKAVTSWIGKHMKAKDPSVIMAQVTPATAKMILETYNTENRAISRSLVARYTNAMIDNRWLFTGESIIFSNTRLLNGQQRLTACVESGKSFDSVLVFGVADEAFEVMDTGKRRSAGDVLGMIGVPYSNSVSAILRFVTLWDQGHRSRQLWKPLDNDEVVTQWYQRMNVLDSVPYAQKASKAGVPMSSTIASMHYLAAQKCKRDADDFFTRVVEGLNFEGRKDPAYVLRNKLIAGSANGKQIERVALVNYVASAWNHFRKGSKITNLRAAEKVPSLR